MNKLSVFIVVIIAASVCAQGFPSLQIPADTSPEVLEELNRLVRMERAYRQRFALGFLGGLPGGVDRGSGAPYKRNSESINSLLGLPRTMLDVGRK